MSLGICSYSVVQRRIENGALGLPPPEPLGQDLHYFLLGDDTFALMPCLVKPYSRRQLTREERIANYRISRGSRVMENAFGILASRFRVLLTTMEQRPKVMTCVVLHNMLRSEAIRGSERHPTPTDNIQPPQNDQGEQGQDENVRNPSSVQNVKEIYFGIF